MQQERDKEETSSWKSKVPFDFPPVKHHRFQSVFLLNLARVPRIGSFLLSRRDSSPTQEGKGHEGMRAHLF